MSYFELTEAQRELADYMSKLSNEHACAGWLGELEFALWSFVVTGPGEFYWRHFGQEKIDWLNQLSAACVGWIVWRDEDESETFLPMDEWLKLCEAHERQVTPCG